ncbi:MAG: ATP-binding cassette domain-containing protein [Deltaproteobacteria bacterium]|nr:ATP-binding cassette domain-containing protein [Deltaproteobacteria bacterium]
MIRLFRVEKRHGRETLALKGVSCTVGKGELVFLVGPSGAGKTTLLRLLTGEELPTAGEVVVLGQNVAQLSTHQLRLLRRRMGLIFQASMLLPDLPVEENVALPLRVAGVRQQQIRQRVGGMLERLGIQQLHQRLPPSLSAGEAQRVAIARALIGRPLLVLADEPTGNLDPRQAREVLRLLVELAGEGTSLLVATHDPAVLQAGTNQRILALEAGQLRSTCGEELR